PLFLSAALLIRGVPHLIGAFDGHEGCPLDFQYLVDGGRVITSDHPGWLYQPPRQLNQFQFAYGYPYPGSYAYAPPFAYASPAFGEVDLCSTAWNTWKAGVFFCMLVVALLTASVFKSWAWRLAVVLAALTWQPLLTDARFGQSGALAAALAVGGVFLFLRNK